MKISELRIGNWVLPYTHRKDPVKVFHLHKDDRNRINYVGEDQYDPIPLTAELLVKFGAKIVHSRAIFILDGPHRTLEAVFYGPNIFIELYESPELSSDELKHFTIGGIKYLHQLQNLYHALIGEELPVNL